MPDLFSTERLKNILMPAIQTLGFELVDCQLVNEFGRKTLRILIDAEDGVKAGDAVRLNHQIMAILTAEAPEYTACDVEVSSPGLDRPLITLEHFQRFLNRDVKIKLLTPLDNCSHFTGTLLSATADSITLSMEDKIITINFDNIRKANLVPDVRF